MNNRIRAFLLTSIFSTLAGLAGAQNAAEGDSPTHSFRTPVLNGSGLASLEELRGRPVLVEFWGTR
jgi:hypothetical protein